MLPTPAGRRHYASIHRDEYVDVWLICWSPGNDTGWHDHDVSLRSGPRGAGRAHGVQTPYRGVHGCKRSSPKAAHSPSGLTIFTGSPVRLSRVSPCTPTHPRYGGSVSTPSMTAACMRRVSVCYADELRPLDRRLPSRSRSPTGRCDGGGRSSDEPAVALARHDRLWPRWVGGQWTSDLSAVWVTGYPRNLEGRSRKDTEVSTIGAPVGRDKERDLFGRGSGVRGAIIGGGVMGLMTATSAAPRRRP